MLTVHHLNNSRSQRVLWLLEELGVPYEIVHHKRDAKTNLAPPELRKIHPLGKSPVIEHDGRVVAETAVIVEYILETFGEGRLSVPAGHPKHWDFRYWMHYAEGSAMPPLLMKLMFTEVPKRAPGFIRLFANPVFKTGLKRVINPWIVTHTQFWEDSLAGSGWFVGEDFTAADVMMSFPVEAGGARVGYADKPNLRGFLERIHTREAYQRALEKGGPYAYA